MEESKSFKDKINSNDVNSLGTVSTSEVELTHRPNNLASCIWINRDGKQLPVECSLNKNQALFNEISKVEVEECEGVKSYKIFNRLGSITDTKGLSKTDLPELYKKVSLKETCLGVVEETISCGVIEFEGKDAIKNYICNFMASCKLDYGGFSSLLNSLAIK